MHINLEDIDNMNDDLFELALLFYNLGMIEECKNIVKLILYLEIKEILEKNNVE